MCSVSAPAEQTASAASRLARWTWLLWGLLAVLAWDVAGLDLPLAHWTGTSAGFAWRDHVLLSGVLHSGARALGWVVLLACTLLAVRPLGSLKVLSPRERGSWVGGIWFALLAVVLLKGISRTSCPWDLDVFGGATPYVSHWALATADGGPGHCFPAGHASTGFAFVAGYFGLVRQLPTLARRWLWAAVVGGAVLGVAQQLRGAHFMSHTLWTAWLCWLVGAVFWRITASKTAEG